MPCARLERCLLIRPAFNRRDFNIPAHGFRLTFKKGLTVGQLVERPGTVAILQCKGLTIGDLSERPRIVFILRRGSLTPEWCSIGYKRLFLRFRYFRDYCKGGFDSRPGFAIVGCDP